MTRPHPTEGTGTPDGAVDGGRLLQRLDLLGRIGRTPEGALTRLALTDADGAARKQVVAWMREAGMSVAVDAIGNLFGTWDPAGAGGDPVMTGSHIDTVVNAGLYDGNYGVLAGIEVVSAMQAAGFVPVRPLCVAVFTNEEGARYAPDMMGSLVHAGGLALDEALDTIGTDGTRLGDELVRIGFRGDAAPGAVRPHAFVELHIEQGPILEHDGIAIGAVETLQGISWQKLSLHGQANHAGTTPMHMRRDAGYGAALITSFVHDLAARSNGTTVATVGKMRLAPDVINVIPSFAELTVDVRDTDDARLSAAEAELAAFIGALSERTGLDITAEPLVRTAPVVFDPALVELIEAVTAAHGLSCRRMTSGAGHDAQMIARIAPAAMIFVPSHKGISHNPREHSDAGDLVAGANVLLDVMARLAGSAA